MSWFWILYFWVAAGFAVWIRRRRPRKLALTSRWLVFLWPILVYKLLVPDTTGSGPRRAQRSDAFDHSASGGAPVEEISIAKYGAIDDSD